jgi:hypothetical protein
MAIPGLGLAEVFFKVADKALGIYDYHLKTKYAKEYRRILEELQEEEAKPVYAEDDVDPEEQRDQNRIDRLHYKMKILLEKFVSDEGIKNFEKD